MKDLDEFQLCEKRIDDCFRAASLANDSEMREFWINTAMALMRKLNRSWVREGDSVYEQS